MTSDQRRLEELLDKYTRSEVNQPEFNELCNMIKASGNDALLKEILERELSSSAFVAMNKEQLDSMLKKILSASSPALLHKEKEATVRRMWRRWAVAASVILAVGIGNYFLFFNRPAKQENISKTNQAVPHDVKAPESNRATITLADGRIVYLDSVGNGTLATTENVQIVKLADGKIAYNGSAKEVVYNTLNNPRGSKVIDMAFSDGSHIWLNAGSSVTYPVAFVGDERKVSITGEAYFEIAHDAAKPFYVSKGDVKVQVLGTHFNVNAYDDEPDVKVTLLEGLVKIKNGNESDLLKPGQQAQVSDKIIIAGKVNVEEIMAWKNGLFNFSSTDIKTMMRQIEKWYNVKVVYQDDVSELFVAKISRDVPLSEFLKLIELTDLVHFRIEGLPDGKAGKTIVVMK